MRKVLADTHVAPAWQRWGARVGLSLALAIAIAYVPWRAGGEEKIEKLRAQASETDAEIARLEAANAKLHREIDALRTDVGAIVDRARDELGMVYPGEVVLRVEAP
ncbi:MAG TPA: septum formation initiator family protein [Kofleriaceae bacterium]|nr:septum formation initiator family protein [Kofleriaceae bacterium]